MRRIQQFFVIVMLTIAALSTALAQDATGQTATIAVDGIKTVNIDMKTGKATVVLRQDAHVDDQALRQAVKKAGFTARDITRQ